MILGIGLDVVDIRRLRRAMSRHGERFLERIFVSAEREFCQARKDPAPHFAVRFAAKEALFKALGTGWARGIRWLDVEVQRSPQGPPSLRIHGEAGRRLKTLGARKAHLSLSHSEISAAAVVILEG